MCRMAAFSTVSKVSVLNVFKHVSEMAINGKGSPHNDGYGIVILDDVRKYEYKSLTPIYEDVLGANLLKDIYGSCGIIHARKASDGIPVGVQQLHPFYIEGKYLAHNGTITDADKSNPFKSDTYDFFYNIFKFKTFNELLGNIKKYIDIHDFSGMNFFILDELDGSLYVGCIYNCNEDYFTLHYKLDQLGFFVYSEKVINEEPMTSMRNGQVLKIKDGKIIEEGKVF